MAAAVALRACWTLWTMSGGYPSGIRSVAFVNARGWRICLSWRGFGSASLSRRPARLRVTHRWLATAGPSLASQEVARSGCAGVADVLSDLYVSNIVGGNRLYRNMGSGGFIDEAERLGMAEPTWSFPAWFWDVDNDSGAMEMGYDRARRIQSASASRTDPSVRGPSRPCSRRCLCSLNRPSWPSA